MSQEARSEAERQAAIEFEMQQIFSTVLDMTEADLPEDQQGVSSPNQETPLQSARRKEFAEVLRNAREILAQRLDEGSGKVKSTIQETFAGGEVTEPVSDHLVDAIPSVEGGKLMMVTDVHGDLTVLKEAVKRFLGDDKAQLAVLGDMVAGGGLQQVEALEAIFKLYSKYPDRVHILRGNCEAAVFPEEGSGEQVYEATGMVGWRQGMSRLQDIFTLLPAVIVTENGVAATHGSLPRPKIENGENRFSNLSDINEFGNYLGNVMLPVWTKLGQSAEEKIKLLGLDKGGPLKDMLWGDIDTVAEHGYPGVRAYVSGSEDVTSEIKTIGASVLFRGHQSKLLKNNGSNVVIDDKAPVVTFHSSFKGDKKKAYFAEVPLDKPIDQISDEMFVGVEREEKK